MIFSWSCMNSGDRCYEILFIIEDHYWLLHHIIHDQWWSCYEKLLIIDDQYWSMGHIMTIWDSNHGNLRTRGHKWLGGCWTEAPGWGARGLQSGSPSSHQTGHWAGQAWGQSPHSWMGPYWVQQGTQWGPEKPWTHYNKGKGSHHQKKVLFLWTLSVPPLAPPGLRTLRGVFFLKARTGDSRQWE